MKPYAICFAVLLLAGCSSEPNAIEPTSEDFLAFVETEKVRISGPGTLKDGTVIVWEMDLEKHDLRKTDSLTSPFQGTATFAGEAKQTHSNGKTTTYPASVTNTYRWVDGAWTLDDASNDLKKTVAKQIDIQYGPAAVAARNAIRQVAEMAARREVEPSLDEFRAFVNQQAEAMKQPMVLRGGTSIVRNLSVSDVLIRRVDDSSFPFRGTADFVGQSTVRESDGTENTYPADVTFTYTWADGQWIKSE